ncbi:MAG: HlyD family secretion protein [Terriglobia bacterium]|jgi:membrane fusion protein (multidrug efflux system)
MAEPTVVEPRNELEEGMAPNSLPRSRFRGNPHTPRLLLAGASLLVILAVGLWTYYSARESTDDAQIDGHIIPISPRVGGTVVAVNIDDNQYVEAGTLLVQIDPTDYRVALERAKGDYEDDEALAQAAGTNVPITTTTRGSQVSTAEANVRNAEAGIAVAEQEVDAAKARWKSAQARLVETRANETKAARDLDRMKLLVSKEEISQQQYDAAVAEAEATHASADSAQAEVAEADQNVKVAESRLAQARDQLAEKQAEERSARTAPQHIEVTRHQAAAAEAKAAQAKAAMEQAQLNLQYTAIRAPVSGIISKKSVEVGQMAEVGGLLLAIVPLEDIWVTANFKETQLKKMRTGESANVVVDAYGGRQYKGHVESIAAATGAKFSLLPPENAAGNYVKVVQRVPVKIVFEKGQDPEHLLRPGMSVIPTVYVK